MIYINKSRLHLLEENMEEHKYLIEAFKIALAIPIVYIIAFFIKGKDRNISGFFMAIVNCLGMYFSSLIPIMLEVIIWEKSAENDLIITIFLNILAFIFSTPFIASLIKSIDCDFNMPFGFKNNMISAIMYLVISFILIVVFIGGIFGFVTGYISISALLAMMYMSVGGGAVVIVSFCKNFLGKDMKKLEKKLGLLMIFLTFVLFLTIMICEIYI